MDNQTVRYVLFDVPLHPGSLSLVEMDDGSLRILMNDQPLAGCHWHPGQVPLAVRRFQEIKSTLTRPTTPPPNNPAAIPPPHPPHPGTGRGLGLPA